MQQCSENIFIHLIAHARQEKKKKLTRTDKSADKQVQTYNKKGLLSADANTNHRSQG